jgi:hypothetical protein
MLQRLMATLRGLLGRINLRFIVITAMTLIALYGFFILNKTIEIVFRDDGATVLLRGSEPKSVVVLLPASRLWLDSGIELKPGQKVNVSASGAINLSVHRLTEAAQNTIPPKHGWTTPSGVKDRDDLRCIDQIRESLLIEPRASYGSLLAYIKPANAAEPNVKNPIPPNIQVINSPSSQLGYSNPDGLKGRLYFTVNDIVLKNDAKYKQAFISDPACLDRSYGKDSNGKSRFTVAQMEQKWDRVTTENYWNIWFDDNIGEFLVKISYD